MKVNTTKIEQLLDTESKYLGKLNEIVMQSIEEKKLISEKILESEEKHLSLGSKMADKIASFGGSWTFILSFFFLLIGWILLNIYFLKKPIDPFPFILLNLILSTIAALQAPIIMMSQNRKEEKDRERAINDYMINLKAEIEIRNLNQKLELLIADQMKTLFEIQKMQMDMMEQLSRDIKNNSE
jgi:uncharacterized membrane protein